MELVKARRCWRRRHVHPHRLRAANRHAVPVERRPWTCGEVSIHVAKLGTHGCRHVAIYSDKRQATSPTPCWYPARLRRRTHSQPVGGMAQRQNGARRSRQRHQYHIVVSRTGLPHYTQLLWCPATATAATQRRHAALDVDDLGGALHHGGHMAFKLWARWIARRRLPASSPTRRGGDGLVAMNTSWGTHPPVS